MFLFILGELYVLIKKGHSVQKQCILITAPPVLVQSNLMLISFVSLLVSGLFSPCCTLAEYIQLICLNRIVRYQMVANGMVRKSIVKWHISKVRLQLSFHYNIHCNNVRGKHRFIVSLYDCRALTSFLIYNTPKTAILSHVHQENVSKFS